MAVAIETRLLAGAEFYYHGDLPCIKLGTERLELGQEPLESLLNILKVPTKYLFRLASEDIELANSNVNFWLDKRDNISVVIKGGEVVQIVEGTYAFISSDAVIKFLGEYLHCATPLVVNESGLVVAQFRTLIHDIELESGETAFVSVRLTYSESLSVVPKIDAILTVNGSFESYCFPIQQRKFRVVGMTDTHILNEMIEFVDIVCEQLQKQFVPALNKMIGHDARLNVYGFVDRLCSELRLSKRFCVPLINGADEDEISLHKLVRIVSNNLVPEARCDEIDYMTARDIEIALSKAIMYGRFK